MQHPLVLILVFDSVGKWRIARDDYSSLATSLFETFRKLSMAMIIYVKQL